MATQHQIIELKKQFQKANIVWTKKDELRAKNQVWKEPETKNYKGMQVDKQLNTSILDKLNQNKNIKVVGVCAGHKYPTEFDQQYKGNVPEINFVPKTDKKKICPLIKKIMGKDTKCNTSKKYNFVKVSSTKKGTDMWWKKAEKAISKTTSTSKKPQIISNPYGIPLEFL